MKYLGDALKINKVTVCFP